MPAKRNDVEEESAAEREIAFTRAILAWVLVLVILFWITSTPSPSESSSVQFLIRGSLGGGDASMHGEGECAEGAEMIRTTQTVAEDFNAPHAMVAPHALIWTDPKQVALWWGPKGLTATIERGGPAPQFEMMATFAEEGKTRLAMGMVFVPADGRDQNVRE
ncbi:MAG TPA: hypothetical protein VK684_06240 [Edaphobacter sp.]|nr:hypothetical protein [Edaphobacter sp.]